MSEKYIYEIVIFNFFFFNSNMQFKLENRIMVNLFDGEKNTNMD